MSNGSIYPNPITAARTYRSKSMKKLIDDTLGRIGKYSLWKLGLVDLMWFYGTLRIIRTNADTGERFIFSHDGEKWTNVISVDAFLDSRSDDDNIGAYDDKRRFSENGFFGYAKFTGFFSKPKIKNHIFKSKKVKVLHMTAAWDRDVLKGQETQDNIGAIASHTHQLAIIQPPPTPSSPDLPKLVNQYYTKKMFESLSSSLEKEKKNDI